MENKIFNKKTIYIILIDVLGIFVVASFLVLLHQKIALSEVDSNMSKEKDALEQTISLNDDLFNATIAGYDEMIQESADTLAYKIKTTTSFKPYQLNKFSTSFKAGNILILDRDGEVLAQKQPSPANFKKRRYNELFKAFNGKSEPFEVYQPDDRTYRYYSSRIDAQRIVVYEVDTALLFELLESYIDWDFCLKNVSVGTHGFPVVVSADEYIVIYHPNSDYLFKDVMELGIDSEAFRDGYHGYIKVDGKKYYTGVYLISGAYVMLMVPNTELRSARQIAVLSVVFVFFLILTLMISYSSMIMRQSGDEDGIEQFYRKLPGGWFLNVTVARKAIAFVYVGTLIVFCVSWYVQTLYSMSLYSMNNEHRMSSVQKNVESHYEEEDYYHRYFDELFNQKIIMAADVILSDWDNCSNEKLMELKDVLGVDSLEIYDNKGVAVFSTRNDIGNKLLDVHPGFAETTEVELDTYTIMYPSASKNDDGEQLESMELYSKEYGALGLLVLGSDDNLRASLNTSESIGTILKSIVTDMDTTSFAIDKESGKIVYHPLGYYESKNCNELGLTDKELRDGYSGYFTFANEGEYCYLSCFEAGEYYIFVATPVYSLRAMQLPLAIASSAACLLFFIVEYVIICFSRHGGNTLVESDNIFDMSNQNAEDRWKKIDISWNEKTPEQKLFTIFRVLLFFGGVFIIAFVFLGDSITGSESILSYILNGNWDKGINIFSLTAVLVTVCIAGVATGIIRKVLDVLAASLDARGTTVCRMIRSAVKYIAAIVIIFYSLNLFGVGTATLLTSAGVMSLAIGLGANSLLSDIIAGIFLIFEGEFRVGDIVTIDGWRGTVLDIGIRTTKIEDLDKNIKIIANSKVSGIINMTNKVSFAKCAIGIDYNEDIERVERIITGEFPRLKKHLKKIKGNIKYSGVMALGDNAVIIRIEAECHEADRPYLERELNREILLIFRKNNINVPYPQIVVNEPIDYSKR